jgi:hypothetical protein
MDKPPQPTLSYKIKKPVGTHALLALGHGAAFAGIDFLGNMFYKAIKPFIYPPNFDEIQREMKKTRQEQNKQYDRSEIIKLVTKHSEKDQTTAEKSSEELPKRDQLEYKLLQERAIGNFFYGTLFLKLGKEIRNVFLNKYLKSVNPDIKVFMTYPVPILAYYTFFNYFEGKSTEELFFRLTRDFLLLLSVRVIVGAAERKIMANYDKMSKANANNYGNAPLKYQMEMKNAVKKTTFQRNITSAFWIFTLTYLYQHPVYAVPFD